MCAVVTCVQVINFVHVVVFVCVVIFVRVILLCDVHVYKACMDTYYQSDTSNDSIQVYIKDVCTNVHDATCMQTSVVLRQKSTTEKQQRAENIIQPRSAH